MTYGDYSYLGRPLPKKTTGNFRRNCAPMVFHLNNIIFERSIDNRMGERYAHEASYLELQYSRQTRTIPIQSCLNMLVCLKGF